MSEYFAYDQPEMRYFNIINGNYIYAFGCKECPSDD